MSTLAISASKREPGRKIAKEARRNGSVPGVAYSKNFEPVHFTIPALNLRPVVYTAEAKLIQLDVDGVKMDCILKDVTFDPITDAVLHVDFLRVVAGEVVNVEIPIHIVGTADGVRSGGVLEMYMHKLHVRVDPHTMPEHIDVNVTSLAVGSSLHIRDLDTPGVQILDRADALVVQVAAGRASKSAAA
jgi:large subunit ribosomal protein L25